MTKKDILTHINEITSNAERGYWWATALPAHETRRLGIDKELRKIQRHLLEVEKIGEDLKDGLNSHPIIFPTSTQTSSIRNHETLDTI